MHLDYTLRRMASVILLTALYGCQSCDSLWEYEESIAYCPTSNSARVIFPYTGASDGLELEIVRTPDGTRMYFNARYCPIESDDEWVKITYSFGNCEHKESVDSWAALLEGGQRILLFGQDADRITQALLDNYTVDITIGDYEKELTPGGFEKPYQALYKVPGL